MKHLVAFLPFSLFFLLAFAQDLKVELSPETLVSHNEGGALRVEPSGAIYGSVIVVAWNDSYGGMQTKRRPGVSIGWAISQDRGKSFQFGGYLPRTKGDTLQPGADSWVATDEQGNFYLQALSWRGNIQEIHLYYMSRSRLGAWQKRPSPIRIDKSKTGFAIDKPAMYVSKGGEILIAYTVTAQPQHIFLVRSTDKGQSWVEPVQLSDSENGHKTGANLAGNSKKVTATWMEESKEIWYSLSVDAGRSFDRPAKLYTLSKAVSPPSGYALGVGPAADIANNPWIAADRAGNFYLAATEGAKEEGTRILLFELTDGQEQWSGPVVVGHSPDTSPKVFPAVAVAGSSVAVLHYDRRAGPESSLTDVHLSLREPMSTWKDLKLNTVSTDWLDAPGDKEYAMIQRNFGDYITLAAQENTLLALWTDAREGPSRIYSRVITLAYD